MSFTLVNSGSTSNNGGGGTLGVAVTGVHANDLVFVAASHGTDTGTITCSDGTSTLTPLTQINTSNSSTALRGFYILASVASGTVTYTATYTGTPTNRSIDVYVFTPSAAATFDQQNGTEVIATTAGVSGNVTTTIADTLAFGAQTNENQSASSVEQINSVTRVAVIDSGTGASLWYTTPSSTFSGGQASETIGSSTRILTAIATFGISGGAVARPFITFDSQLYPQKPRNVDFIKNSETRLIGKDKFFLGAGQAPTYDYPNPVGTTYRQVSYPTDLRTFTKGLNPLLLGKDKFYNGAGLGPDFDYPNPLGTTYRQIQFPAYLRTHLNPLNQLLLGKDVFYGGAGYGPDFDFPNPLIARRDWSGWAQSTPLNLNTIIVAAPFTPLEWPNPLRYRNVIDWAQALNLELVGSGLQPFDQLDWPNPFPPDPTLRPDWNIGTPLNLFGGGIRPFNFTEWSNPTTPKPVSRPDWITGLDLLVTGGGVKPFNLTEWPVTRKVPSILQEFVEALNLQLVGGGKQPFSLSDWQNPNILRIGKLDWILGLDLNVVGGGIQPFSLSDWANPLIIPATPRGDVYLNELILQLLTSGPAPFAQLDWTNPVRIPLREFGYTNADDFIRRSTSPSAPFGQNDWPNPQGYVLAIDARTLVADLLQTTLRPPAPIQTSSSLVLIEGRLAKHVSGIIYVWV